MFEIRKESEGQASEICAAVRDAISHGLGVTPTSVVAIRGRSISKTSSGKIQRRKTRQMLKHGLLPIVYKLGQDKDENYRVTKFSGTLEDLLEEKYNRILASVLGASYDP